MASVAGAGAEPADFVGTVPSESGRRGATHPNGAAKLDQGLIPKVSRLLPEVSEEMVVPSEDEKRRTSTLRRRDWVEVVGDRVVGWSVCERYGSARLLEYAKEVDQLNVATLVALATPGLRRHVLDRAGDSAPVLPPKRMQKGELRKQNEEQRLRKPEGGKKGGGKGEMPAAAES